MSEEAHSHLAGVLDRAGLRSTRQRELVFELLQHPGEHPTADEVFARARAEMPTISLATVYNCLETLVQCGLVRAVHKERQPTRYCGNLREHAHFHDTSSGRVFDIDLSSEALDYLKRLLPAGYDIDAVELNFHGINRNVPGDAAASGGA